MFRVEYFPIIYLFEFMVFFAVVEAALTGTLLTSVLNTVLTPNAGCSTIANKASSAAVLTFSKLSPSFSTRIDRMKSAVAPLISRF